ncbi:MAG TPA: hypothetical protein VGJ30_07160, partial [Candidatus Angelobacter sp.]
MNIDWQQYQKELHDVIADPSKDIVLDAEYFYDPTTGNFASAPGGVFQLTSGRNQRKFVTLWQLFDEPEFPSCVQHLSEKVREIRRHNSFGAIVTCTATSRHLMDSIHSEIETREGSVNSYYFGPYPFVNVEMGTHPEIRGQRVLILTDVVATGSLIKQMTQTVNELEGKVVGAVCVVLTGPDLIATCKSEGATSYEVDGR